MDFIIPVRKGKIKILKQKIIFVFSSVLKTITNNLKFL
jgi:hypothetical protein